MTIQEVREKAKERLKGWCNVCLICEGKLCAGKVPGMGGIGRGQSFQANIEALSAWNLNMRTLHDAGPVAGKDVDTAIELFGQRLSIPVMGAPMAGTAYNMGNALTEEELAQSLHKGCREAGTLCWSGDGARSEFFDIGLQVIQSQGGVGIPTIKPRPVETIIERIRQAEQAGVTAIAIDVDAAGFQAMTAAGQPVGPLPASSIAKLVASTRLPLILKGIMTPDEAALAASLGVAGIVVSNHGGRVLDCCPGTAEVLPSIVEAVHGRLRILFDGGIRRGVDILKALALGADAVLVGRPLIVGAAGGGAEGVALMLRTWQAELSAAMILTGTTALTRVSPTILRRSSS